MRAALRTVRLADVADGRDNNFDVLRLVAASLVLVSHSFPLTGNIEPLGRIGGPTMGALGVALFFAMSGFLIVKSWTWAPRVTVFFRKRALRIMPALWVAVAVTVLVLGPLLTTLPLGTYFASPSTWTYLLRCSVLVTFDGSLPGLFESNPFPNAVNGSLWTLPIEVCAYGMIVVLGIAGVLKRRVLVLVGLCVSIAVATLGHSTAVADPLMLVTYFLAGATTYTWRDRITLAWLPALVLLGIWIACFGTMARVPVGFVALTYVTFVAAYVTPKWLAALCAAGDVSYGVYIYAFPVQQAVVQVVGSTSPLTNVLVAGPVAWLIALASWRLVEQPALRFKPKQPVQPSPQPVPAPILQER